MILQGKVCTALWFCGVKFALNSQGKFAPPICGTFLLCSAHLWSNVDFTSPNYRAMQTLPHKIIETQLQVPKKPKKTNKNLLFVYYFCKAPSYEKSIQPLWLLLGMELFCRTEPVTGSSQVCPETLVCGIVI